MTIQKKEKKETHGFPFAGMASFFVGSIISAQAIFQKNYIWLTGSVPLAILGIWLIFQK